MPPKKRTRTSPASDVSKRSKQGRSPPQHQEGTSFVSLTMESEVVTVKEELSGPETANLSDSITSLRLWCQDCGENAAESCVDSGHFLCSLRQLRLKQAAPKQQRLDKIASSAREVVKALQDARDELEAQLEQWRGRLRLLQEAEKELWAAVDEGRDLEEPALEEGLEQMLHDTTSLLRAKCKLQMDGSSSTWRAELPEEAPGSRRSLLFPLVLQLHRDKSLIKVFRPDECLDVHELSMPREHCQELDDALQNPGLDKVRKLDGVCCQERPNWCKLLLQRVAPHVEWLRVCNAVREHLEVITDMPALRYLRAHIIGARDAPDLPLQLQDLQLTNSSEEHFHCVQRMANLRKLSLKCHRVLDVTFPLLPAGHCGLQWLSVSLRPASTVLSLATAHAATLQELRILCASEGDDPWHFKDLAEGLRQCGLVALRRVVLMRGSAPGYPTKKLPHAAESCQRQKQDVWDKLLATGSDRPVSIVKVMCKDCDDCPAFPLLGDFTWIDE